MFSGAQEIPARVEGHGLDQVVEPGRVELGLVAAPGLPGDGCRASIVSEFARELDHRFRGAQWRVRLLVDPLVETHADATELEPVWGIATSAGPIRLGLVAAGSIGVTSRASSASTASGSVPRVDGPASR